MEKCISCGEITSEGKRYCKKREKDCDTCAHETENSGYCLDCYFGNKWQRKDGKQNG